MTATLSIVLWLSVAFGGPTVVARDLVFESPAACGRFMQTLERITVRHEVLRSCNPPPPPRPDPAAPGAEEPPDPELPGWVPEPQS